MIDFGRSGVQYGPWPLTLGWLVSQRGATFKARKWINIDVPSGDRRALLCMKSAGVSRDCYDVVLVRRSAMTSVFYARGHGEEGTADRNGLQGQTVVNMKGPSPSLPPPFSSSFSPPLLFLPPPPLSLSLSLARARARRAVAIKLQKRKEKEKKREKYITKSL